MVNNEAEDLKLNQKLKESCQRINEIYQLAGTVPQLFYKIPEVGLEGPDSYKVELLKPRVQIFEEILSDYEEWWSQEQNRYEKEGKDYNQERKKYLSLCLDQKVWVVAHYNARTGQALTLSEKRELIQTTGKLLSAHWMKSHEENIKLFNEIIAKENPILKGNQVQMAKYEDLFRMITDKKFFEEIEEKVGVSSSKEAKQVAEYSLILDKFPPLLNQDASKHDLTEQAIILLKEHDQFQKGNRQQTQNG